MKRLIPSLILLVLLLGSVFFVQKYYNKPVVPELYTVPAFEFPSQQGVSFSNKNFNNKISVVDFIFTNCPGICPLMTKQMADFYNEYSDQKNIQFVSFSVDPARDSLEALKSYADKWHVNDNRWYFLRTEKERIQDLYQNGFKLGGELPYGHSGVFVLVDNKGMIRGYYTYNDDKELKLLKDDISVLLDDI